METITVKIDTKTKGGKAFKAMLEVFDKVPGIKVVEEKNPYNPKFVQMIQKSSASKKRYRVDNVDTLWESL